MSNNINPNLSYPPGYTPEQPVTTEPNSTTNGTGFESGPEKAANPLIAYFRQPKLKVELPSHGAFYPPGTLDMSEDYMVDIYPMTAADEIIMKSPDGLLTGTSIADTIASCVPAIKSVWEMPSIDVDTILIAIKIASYGNSMDISTKCPKCGNVNDDAVDLHAVLDTIPKGNLNTICKTGDLTVELQPYTFKYANAVNRQRFEQERAAKAFLNSDMPEEKKHEHFEAVFKELALKNTQAIATAIKSIVVGGSTIVTDRNQILEFIANADRNIIKDIKNGIQKLNDVQPAPVALKCADENCGHEYTTTLDFNQSTFFE